MADDNRIDAGKQETVAMLYEKLGRAAISKTKHIVKQQGVAEEIVHDVFVKMWQKKPVFESLRMAYAWVYRSCTNSAIDFLRGKGNRSEAFEDFHQHAAASDDEAESKIIAKGVVQELMQKLDEREASVFVYRYLEGLGQEEMAEVMGVSRSTIVRLLNSVNEKMQKVKEQFSE